LCLHSSVKHELPRWASSLSHATLAIIVRSLLSPPRYNNKPSPLLRCEKGRKRSKHDVPEGYERNIAVGRFYGRLSAIEPYPVTRKRKAVWRANDYLVGETCTFDVFCDTRTRTLVLMILFKSYSCLSRVSFWKTPSEPSNIFFKRKSKNRSLDIIICCGTSQHIINKILIILNWNMHKYSLFFSI